MTPVLCESFNNNNNNNNNSVGVCGFPDFQKQPNISHYPDHHHSDPTYPYAEVEFIFESKQISLPSVFFQLPGGEGGDGGEGWSEGDDGSVDGVGREVYLGPEHGSSNDGRGEVYNNSRGPAYQGGFTTTSQHPNFYNTDIAMYDSYQVRCHIIIAAVMPPFVVKSNRIFPILLLSASSCFFHMRRWHCRLFCARL